MYSFVSGFSHLTFMFVTFIHVVVGGCVIRSHGCIVSLCVYRPLFIHSTLNEHLVISSFKLLWNKPALIFWFTYHTFLLGLYLRMELLGFKLFLFSVLMILPRNLLSVCINLNSQGSRWAFRLLQILTGTWRFLSFLFSVVGECIAASHCDF